MNIFRRKDDITRKPTITPESSQSPEISPKNKRYPTQETQLFLKNPPQHADIEHILTQGGGYIKIFPAPRKDKKEELSEVSFEIYIRQTTNSSQNSPNNARVHSVVKQALEQENLLFVNTTHQNMGSSNLSKTAPDESNFARQKYLIRANNTLRFASKDECIQLGKLDIITLDQGIGYTIMNSSYATAIMSAHDNVIPYKNNTVNKIFSDSNSLFEIYHIKDGDNQQENFHQLVKEAMEKYQFLFMIAEDSTLTNFVPTKDKFLNKTHLIRETYTIRFPTNEEIQQLEDLDKMQILHNDAILRNCARAKKLKIKNSAAIKETNNIIDKAFKESISKQFQQFQQKAYRKTDIKHLFRKCNHIPYELIFTYGSTECNIFQIYYRDIEKIDSCPYQQAYNEIKKLMEDIPNLFFIIMDSKADCCTISKELPRSNKFIGEKYLIREQNTLRFATKEEATTLNKQLAEFKSKQPIVKINTMKSIMQNSNAQAEKVSPKAHKTT
jgi:hypothetical protein